MTTKLNYDNAAALINAFKQGAKFKIVGASYPPNNGPVKDIEPSAEGLVAAWTANGNMLRFAPDGMPRQGLTNSLRLIRDESLGFVERTSVTVGNSIFGWTGKRGEGAKATEPAPALPKPLLQRLLSGEVFHNPKTREILESFRFSKGELVVTLKGEDGKLRTSQNYDHNGKHKWRPERALVAGPVPPKAKADAIVSVFLFESTTVPGKFAAFTLHQQVDHSAWHQVGFGALTAQGKQRA